MCSGCTTTLYDIQRTDSVNELLINEIYYNATSFIKEKIYGEFYSGISLLLTIYFISYVLVLGVKLNQVISFTLTKKDKTN